MGGDGLAFWTDSSARPACVVTDQQGHTMGYTTSGFRSYLSSYGSTGDYVQSDPDGLTLYTGSTAPGNGDPWTPPGAGTVLQGGGGWYFRNYGAVDGAMPAGHYDGGDPAIGPRLHLFAVGPGQFTVWLHNGGVTPTWTLYRVVAGIPTAISTGSVAFPSFSVIVGADGICLHVLEVTGDNNITGYGGFSWLAL